jgi:hypothetical protein
MANISIVAYRISYRIATSATGFFLREPQLLLLVDDRLRIFLNSRRAINL